jgi:hypothetical protein
MIKNKDDPSTNINTDAGNPDISNAPLLKLIVLESISFKTFAEFIVTPKGLKGANSPNGEILIGRSTGCIDSNIEEIGMGAKHAMIKYSVSNLITRKTILDHRRSW